MKLADWLDRPNPDGTRKVRGDFARSIGVTPQMISAYCSGTWPSRERINAIVRETNGEVTANDFMEASIPAAPERAGAA